MSKRIHPKREKVNYFVKNDENLVKNDENRLLADSGD